MTERAATDWGIITYIYYQTLINFLFKEQIPKQLNSLLIWQYLFHFYDQLDKTYTPEKA